MKLFITPREPTKFKSYVGQTFCYGEFFFKTNQVELDGLGRATCHLTPTWLDEHLVLAVTLKIEKNKFFLELKTHEKLSDSVPWDVDVSIEPVHKDAPTKDQTKVLTGIVDKIIVGQHCCLDAPAGTGKTFILSFLKKKIEGVGKRVHICSTTHKSVAVLEKTVYGDIGTIHSLLGLKPQIDYRTGNEKYVVDRDMPCKIKAGDVIICDESSMINAEMLNLIREVIIELRCIFVFVGDSYQLPPVNENISNALFLPNKFVLNKIVRHTNTIVDASVKMREYIDQGKIPTIRDFDTYPDIITLKQNDFDNLFFSRVDEKKSALFVSWTNETVNCQARDVREFLGYKPEIFERGETLVLNEPLIRKRSIVAQNNSVHIVDKVSRCVIDDIVFSKITTTEGITFNTKMDFQDVKTHLSLLAEKAKKEGTAHSWRDFYRFKESCVPVSFHHSCTVHKSQGSTVDEVFVNFRDIVRSDIASKLLYVAITRAAKKVYLLG